MELLPRDWVLGFISLKLGEDGVVMNANQYILRLEILFRVSNS